MNVKRHIGRNLKILSLGTPSVITMITIGGVLLFTESRSGRYPANKSRSFWPVGVAPTFKSQGIYEKNVQLSAYPVGGQSQRYSQCVDGSIVCKSSSPFAFDLQLTLMLTSNVELFRKHRSIPLASMSDSMMETSPVSAYRIVRRK